jgi:lipid II:glycine glycyltransferase (peptidoglycan interpeptide bridge formation enzyme)
MTQLRILADDSLSTTEWDAFVESHPAAHILQSTSWGTLKSQFGWSCSRLAVANEQGGLQAGAQLLFRRASGITLAYIPKGPLTDWTDRRLTEALLRGIRAECQRHGAAFLKIEPDLPDTPQARDLLAGYGFHPSPQTVQPRSTIVVDIAGDESEILARMKSKWRYNIRLSGRKGVTVRAGSREDLAHFHGLMAATGQRDQFDVHAPAYYERAFDLLVPGNGVFLFAEYEGQPLAAIVVALMGDTAWYLWGASSNHHRNLMPNHALQWAGMRWARQQGAIRYDLWGIPDEIGQLSMGCQPADGEPVPADRLPVDLDHLPAGELWGVYRFKQGFGGRVVRYVGAWDLDYNPVAYRIYRAGLLALTGQRMLRAQGASGLQKMARNAAVQVKTRLLPTAVERAQSRARAGADVQPVDDPAAWQAALAQLPAPHVLQSWEWGLVKEHAGWHAERFIIPGEGGVPLAAFQFLWRQPVGRVPLRIGYVPKGPVVDWTNPDLIGRVLATVETSARRLGCAFVKIDPDVREDTAPGRALLQLLQQRGWRYSQDQIQFKNTAYSRLDVDEDALLARMKPKWRYNIRLAGRRGITVRQGNAADFETFYRMYAETGRRDGFLVRPFSYYAAVWQLFLDAQADLGNPAGGALLLAEHPDEAEPVAGLFLMRYGPRAWYFYGASSERRRRDMPNYLLQWEAMLWATDQGCTVYDWWGAPTEIEDPEDSMQGVWRFKQGFGAEFQPHVGAWDWPASPALYSLYNDVAPVLLSGLRRLRGQ